MSEQFVTFSRFSVEPGSLIGGRYEVCRCLGTGGMGQVFLVKDRQLNDEQLALKLLQPQFAKDEQVFKRFQNEVVVARSLFHPNIMRIYDFGRVEDEVCYISMEYVGGGSLKDKIQEAIDGAPSKALRGLSFDDALYFLYQVLSAVSYAHGQGVVHRDIKPANVLITAQNQAKLGDFGTARTLETDAQLTRTGQMIGTPGYMSPEQIEGERGGISSDVYALGIMAYELVVGSLPYHGETFYELAVKQLKDPIPAFSGGASGIPRWYEDLVKKAAARKQEDRFASAKEFFEEFVLHLPTEKRRILQKLPSGANRVSEPRRWFITALASVCLLLVLLLVWSAEELPRDAINKEAPAKPVKQEESVPVQSFDAGLPSRAELERDLLLGLLEDEPEEDGILPSETAREDEHVEELKSDTDTTDAPPAVNEERASDVPSPGTEMPDKSVVPGAEFLPIPSAQESALHALSALDFSDSSEPAKEIDLEKKENYRVSFDPADYERHESYSGTILIAAVPGEEASERVLTMDIGFSGDIIGGRARIVGIGNFKVEGRVLPVEVESLELKLTRPGALLELRGERQELGPKKERALSGSFSSSSYSTKGWWRADWVRRNIASTKRLRELIEEEKVPGAQE